MENNTNQLNPMLCKRNCGFFGNAAYDGYCSKCYKDHVKRQNTGSAAGRVTPTTGTSSSAAHNISTAQQQLLVESTSTIPSDVSMTTVMTGEQPSTSITIDTTTTIISTPSPVMSTAHQQTAPIAIPVQQSQKTTTVIDESSSASMTTTPVANITAPSMIAAAADTMSMSCDASALMSSQQPTPSTSLLSTSTTSSAGALGTSVDSGSEKKKRSRCSLESCKRKVGLTGFDCRCGGLYCWEHRYSDKHDCQFDYKELGQDQIRKNNPIVVGEKIQKI